MAKSEQEVIRELQDEMVKRAEKLVLDFNFRPNEAAEKGKAQASKAIEVAQSAGSLLVFINWLRYQAGREKSAYFWTKTADRRSLVKAISEELGWLQNQVAKGMQSKSKEQKNRVTMRGVTRFRGYFRRALIGAEYLAQITVQEVT